VPVVPIKIEGLFELKQAKRYFSSGVVTVKIGGAVRFPEGMPPEEIAARLEEKMENLCTQMTQSTHERG
jgi:hypothetical protein